MTNQEKQRLKEPANKVPADTGRLSIRPHQPKLSDEEEVAIKKFQKALDMKLGELKDSFGLTNEDMYDLLSPFLSGANVVSKICIPPGCKVADPRHVNLNLMAAMHRVFGVSIDELLDECFKSLPGRHPPEK